jgi:hypothetical protein
MTLPPDLSSIGLLVAKCWMHVDAISVSNGIARLIMQFAFGFNSDHRTLVGMPREEAELDDDEAERQGRIDSARIYAAEVARWRAESKRLSDERINAEQASTR